MKSENKYTAFFPTITIKQNGKKKTLKKLSWFFLIFFVFYVIISLITTWMQNETLVELFIELADFFLLLASIFISIIAIQVGNIYNDDIFNLLNDIVETNKPLGLSAEIEENSSIFNKVISILCAINLCLTCVLFVTNAVLKIAELFASAPENWITSTIDINTILIDILMVLLNVLSILDCINLSKEHKTIISKIANANQELFSRYNKLRVDEHMKTNGTCKLRM